MAAAKSTRLAIVEQSLSDILERLADLHPTESTVLNLRALRTKAFAYERTTKGWQANPPSEAQRQAMLKLVLELNVAVMELSKLQRDEAGTPTTGYTPPRTRPPGARAVQPSGEGAEALTRSGPGSRVSDAIRRPSLGGGDRGRKTSQK